MSTRNPDRPSPANRAVKRARCIFLIRVVFLALHVVVFVFSYTCEAAQSRIQWPRQTAFLTTNRPPLIVDGAPQGFLGASFHITSFDSTTTVLRGFIEATNLTGISNAVNLCIRADAICYHIEMLDMNDNLIHDPQGGRYNWIADNLQFAPHETKRLTFRIRLKDYFDVKPGLAQLLFVFDQRMLPNSGEHDEHTRKAWSRERLILRVE